MKKGCIFSVEDLETDKMTVENSSNYELNANTCFDDICGNPIWF